MSETGRWALPLLDAGQAQKEVTHNEALAILDLLQGASAVAVGTNTPPATPAIGQCWVLGGAPVGGWAGHAGALAAWTSGGWRFAGPREGQAVWSLADTCPAVHSGGQWRVGRIAATELFIGGQQVVGARRPAVTAPAGGSVADAEARSAIGAILAALTAHGLIAG
ncbi:DUF2793 domain-containing protein [Sphingomonas sp.]|uniref:DUF2793 domain-containing protein n=1 Tax=Sphingomonas sp. TaxID=28214 RepID=UPI003CC5082E